jgi:hypothetical protein
VTVVAKEKIDGTIALQNECHEAVVSDMFENINWRC